MKTKFTINKCIIASAFMLSVFLNGCRKEEDLIENPESPSNFADERFNPGSYNSQIAQNWYTVELKLIKETGGHVPPVAARELGYTGITLYESLLVGGTINNHSLAGQLNGLGSLPQRDNAKQYAAPLVANAALARIIKSLFGNASASNVALVDSLELATEQQYSGQFNTAVMNRSRDFGRALADAVFSWSMTDGGHQAYLNVFPAYTLPVGPDKWVPTPPLFQPAMLPFWGSNRTFVPTNGVGPVDPPPPPPFSNVAGSLFHNEALIVYNTVNNLTAAQQVIANYWADGGGTFTPPGHNIAIALQVIRNHNLNLLQTASLLAKIGIGQNDAGIVCWREKFNSNLLRPVTYIKNYIDAGWNSYIPTPPFPAYTSGHSTFSGTAAKLLSIRFGNNFAFTDSTKIPYGFAPRSFNNFNDAAQEAAESRLYGGIHYKFDNDNGFACGQIIAANVAGLNW